MLRCLRGFLMPSFVNLVRLVVHGVVLNDFLMVHDHFDGSWWLLDAHCCWIGFLRISRIWRLDVCRTKRSSCLFWIDLRYLSTFFSDLIERVLFAWLVFLFIFFKDDFRKFCCNFRSTRVIEFTNVVDSLMYKLQQQNWMVAIILNGFNRLRCLLEEAVSWDMWMVELVHLRQIIWNMLNGNKRIWWLCIGY